MKKSKAYKNYKFTDKQHSLKGIISTVLAIIALIFLIIGITISFNHKGNGGTIIGLFGFLSFVLSITGFFIAMNSFKNSDLFYLFSYIGAITNTAIWFVMLCVFMIGI